jgi:hypothetical protein
MLVVSLVVSSGLWSEQPVQESHGVAAAQKSVDESEHWLDVSSGA